ncbi:hypothetical protein QQ045_030006 [Rhodiola kirilowii]
MKCKDFEDAFNDFSCFSLAASARKSRRLLEGTGQSVYLNLLRLFAYGTWSEYKSKFLHCLLWKLCGSTYHFVTLFYYQYVLPYDQLMQELDVANVRQLEDFLIECMYAGIVRGKLDQFRRCFELWILLEVVEVAQRGREGTVVRLGGTRLPPQLGRKGANYRRLYRGRNYQ